MIYVKLFNTYLCNNLICMPSWYRLPSVALVLWDAQLVTRLNRQIRAHSQLYLSTLCSLKSFTGLRKHTILRAKPPVQQHCTHQKAAIPWSLLPSKRKQASVETEGSISHAHLFPQLYRKHRILTLLSFPSRASVRSLKKTSLSLPLVSHGKFSCQGAAWI